MPVPALPQALPLGRGGILQHAVVQHLRGQELLQLAAETIADALASGMAGYDKVHRHIITGFEPDTVTGYLSMEPIFTYRPLALSRSWVAVG